MGNCVFGGFRGIDEVIKVITSSGGIMELYTPITVECLTNEFPGHGIFRSRDLFSKPLLHTEVLQVGELYYLLPLNTERGARITREGEIRPSGFTTSLLTPYRMSFDNQRMLKRSESEVGQRCNNSGVWKVKLVISPEQLSAILSQEASTEALVESVRTVAKCGNGISSVSNSDQWSLSSSWKASSDYFT